MLNFKVLSVLVLLSTVCTWTLSGQTAERFTIKGVVTDSEKEPLPGVNIKVKSSGTGTSTNVNGEFTLSVHKKPAELTFSFIGMDTKTITWKGEGVLHVELTASAVGLEDVVITGYQEIDKRKLSSSISSLSMSDMSMKSATSIDQMLQGTVAGMTVLNATSTPGIAPKIRIRGSSSITGNREPIWVVDGIILDEPVSISTEELNNIDNVNFVGNAISGLNPNDIERIDILKDASATAIYGVKAANGVIVVTTKRGKQGTPSVSYTGNMSLTMAPRYSMLNLMNSKERIEMSEEMLDRGLAFKTFLPTSAGYEGELHKLWDREIGYDQFRENVKRLKEMNTDWMRLLFRNAASQQHTVSVSGAGKQMDYYLSLGYLNQPGLNKYENLDRVTAMLKVNIQIIPSLRAGMKINTGFSNAEYPHSSVSLLNYAYRTSRAIPAYDTDGSLYYYDNETTSFANLPFNIFNELENSRKEIKTRNTLINLNLDWKPLEWLKLSSLGGLSLNSSDQENWADERTFYISQSRLIPYGQSLSDSDFENKTIIPLGGELNRESIQSVRYTVRNSIEVNKSLGNHSFYAIMGNELNSAKSNGFRSRRFGYMPLRGKKFASIDINKYKSYAKALQDNPDVITDNTVNTVSMYGAFTYTYDDRYIGNFNIRTDGSNRFGQDKSVRFLPVWSVSGRWNAHRESFLYNAKWLDELAFRASYGVQGNAHPNQTPNLIVRQENYNGTVGEFISTLKQFPNKNLRWEKTVSYNLGLDFAFLNNRFSGAIDVYTKRGYDQIVDTSIAPSNGATFVTINQGDIENKGWELSFNVVPILTKDWTWSLSFNTGKNYNKVIKEGDSQATWSDYVNGSLIKNGTAVNSFYSYRFKGLDPATGLPTFDGTSIKDASGKQVINSQQEAFDAAFVYSGKREPDLSGGFSSSLKFKRFTFNTLFAFSLGRKIRLNDLYIDNGQALPFPQQNMSKEFVDRWREPGDEAHTNIPALSEQHLRIPPYDQKYPIGDNFWAMYNKSDIRVVSGNFLRCRSMSLRYDIGNQLLKSLRIKGGSVSLEASNVFVWKDSRLKGRDPEQLALSTGTIPPQIGYSCQISLTF